MQNTVFVVQISVGTDSAAGAVVFVLGKVGRQDIAVTVFGKDAFSFCVVSAAVFGPNNFGLHIADLADDDGVERGSAVEGESYF